MDRAVSFSYFYGEESEQFSYYRIPQIAYHRRAFQKSFHRR